MNSGFQIPNAKRRFFRRTMTLGGWCLAAIFFAACFSVPNLESAECDAARNTMREFYSIHFGNEMQPSADYLRLREKFLTTDLRAQIAGRLTDKTDYFTATNDYPKAFRIGECTVAAPDRTIFGVVLFWRRNDVNDQRDVKVEAVKENGQWLINKVY